VALSLTLLGGFQARLDPGGLVSLPTRKTQALLAYLGVRPGRAHPRDKLASLLWGESSDGRARDGLRHALAALRRALPTTTPPILLAEGQTLALSAAVVDVDVATFERHVAQGTPEALEQAAAVYGGDLLSGFSLSEPLFEEWLVPERERLRELALEALAKLLACQSKTGATERAIQTAVRLLALDPLQEAVHRALMRLYVRQQRRGAALKQYQLCVEVLQRDLGSEPEAETKQLYLELVRQPPAEPEKATRARRASRRRDVPARVEVPSKDAPLFGRDADRARLAQALDEASLGRGQLVLLVGEAGIGKTSLLGAFADDALSTHARVLLGRCYESTQVLPFGPWVDALRAGAVLADDAVLAALEPAWRAELTRLFPEIAAAGLPPSSDSALRLFESVARLLEHLAALHLLVLLLEDVHWADEMSLRLLAFMTRRIPSRRVLLVVTSRDEELADAAAAQRTMDEISREAHVTRAALAPLTRGDTIDLIRSLARRRGDPHALAEMEEQVWTVSEGNPFVAVETTRALLDGAPLPESPRLPLPDRVRAMIAGRLDRVSGPAGQLAAVAAVIGREVEFGLLHRASGLDEARAAEGVEELVRRRVLHGVGERFDFTHHRLQAVVYDRLLPPRRKLLHRRAGEALEALAPGDPARDPLALGLHFREGEVWDKAVAYLRAAGVDAMARSAYREAVTCLEQALALSQRLPETRERLEQTLDLHPDLRSSLHALGDLKVDLCCALASVLNNQLQFERSRTLLDEAEALARQLDDPALLLKVLGVTSATRRDSGDSDGAMAAAGEAVEIASRLHDAPAQATASYRLGQVFESFGEVRQAAALFQVSIEAVAQGAHDPAPRSDWGTLDRGQILSLSHAFLARALSSLGEFVEARRHGEEPMRLATAIQGMSLIAAHGCLGFVHVAQGDFVRGIPVLESGLALCQPGDAKNWSSNIAGSLGEAYARVGRLAESITLLERESCEAVERDALWYHALLSRRLGTVYLLDERLDEARRHARLALNAARQRKRRGHEAAALVTLGEIHAQSGPPEIEPARTSYQEALALAEPRGMRPLVAHCHLGLGTLYRRTGRPEQAREHLTTAAEMYRDMDMGFWLEKAEVEMKP
jgi:DNA-binding SARP family transcriptional activator